MRKVLNLAVFLPALLLPTGARAHIQLTSPTARYVQDNNGLKTAPCGSGSRSGTVTKLVPGQMLTVTWKESVSHAGHYRIALAASESDFVEPKDLSVPSSLPSWDLADGIPDKTGTQTYSQAVQLPQTECPACVLQLIQVMSAGTDGTNNGTFSGVYHACADVSISAASGDGGTRVEAGTPDGNRPDAMPPDVLMLSDGPVSKDASTPSGGGAGGNGGSGTGGNNTSPSAGGGGSGGATTANLGLGGAGAQASGFGGAVTSGGSPGNGGSGSTSMLGSAVGGSHSGTTAAARGGSSGASAITSVGGRAGGFAASGGYGGSASSTGDGISNSSTSGCSCHVGSATSPRGLAWLIFAGLFLALRRHSRRSN